MSVPAAPKYRRYLIAADGNVVVGDGRVMYVILIGGANVVELALHDHLDAPDNKIGELHSPKEDIRVLDLIKVGGVPFQTGLYLDISGVGASAAVWVDA